jgi:hypothetical protein
MPCPARLPAFSGFISMSAAAQPKRADGVLA